MIKEDYVSFEIAKLLKEKGFNGECRMIYREHDMQMIYHTPNPNNLLDFTTNRGKLEKHSKKQHCDYALCPTNQMALKWLREVHDILIVINGYSLGWYYNVYNTSWNYIGGFQPIFVVDNDVPLKKLVTSSTYEEAVEAALKYTLENLI